MTTLECRLINAAIACYAISNGQIPQGNANAKAIGLAPNTWPKVFVNGLDEINAGFVAETDDGWVVLALRGTLPPFKGDLVKWVLDWLQDFEAGPTNWYVGGRVFGRVETGFANATLSIWPQAMAALSQIDLSAKKGILVTGHSKGAAMTYLAASLLKTAWPHLLIENCCFAAPRTCEQDFAANYDALGLTPFTVRYQNMYDIVPYLPWWPFLSVLAAQERHDSKGASNRLTATAWPEAGNPAFSNAYVPIGHLRYLGPDCVVEYGQQGAANAWAAMRHALDHLDFKEIAEAHSASGRYYACIC